MAATYADIRQDFDDSLGYIINDNFSVTLDGQNLNDQTLKYFARNEDQPRAFYKNGAQYYLSLRLNY